MVNKIEETELNFESLSRMTNMFTFQENLKFLEEINLKNLDDIYFKKMLGSYYNRKIEFPIESRLTSNGARHVWNDGSVTLTNIDEFVVKTVIKNDNDYRHSMRFVANNSQSQFLIRTIISDYIDQKIPKSVYGIRLLYLYLNILAQGLYSTELNNEIKPYLKCINDAVLEFIRINKDFIVIKHAITLYIEEGNLVIKADNLFDKDVSPLTCYINFKDIIIHEVNPLFSILFKHYFRCIAGVYISENNTISIDGIEIMAEIKDQKNKMSKDRKFNL